jgi:hypothetical protein
MKYSAEQLSKRPMESGPKIVIEAAHAAMQRYLSIDHIDKYNKNKYNIISDYSN